MYIKNLIKKTLILIIIVSLNTVYAKPTIKIDQAPFTKQDTIVIESYIFANIATPNHVLIKKEQDKTLKALPGVILASPEIKSPTFKMDYAYDWVRDSAITMDEIARLYDYRDNINQKQKLIPYFINYIKWVNNAQKQIPVNKIATLGEPRFNIDGTIDTTPSWARPQYDGPAMRASTLIHIYTILSKTDVSDKDKLLQQIRHLIETDLNFIAKNWNQPSYSLWEELKDKNFFTEMVQRRALLLGAKFEQQFNNKNQANYYLAQARALNVALIKHWNESVGYYKEGLDNQELKGGDLNVSTILGIILGASPEVDDQFAVDNSKSIDTAFFIRAIFSQLYFINLTHPNEAPLIGRYINDKYDGKDFIYGNPWPLASAYLAEFYYKLAKKLIVKEQIDINPLTINFYKQLNPNLNFNKSSLITREDNPDLFYSIVNNLIKSGDEMLLRVKKYSVCLPNRGCLHLSEQFDRQNGQQASAKDLTWSYISVLAALQSREDAIKELQLK